MSIDSRKNRDLLIMIMALGDAYLDKGLYSEAAKKFNQLIEFNATGAQVYLKLSKALIGLKSFGPEDLKVYQKAVEYDPDDKDLCSILAKAFLSEKRRDPEAIQIYETGLKLGIPSHEKLTIFLIEHYADTGELQKCKSASETLLTRSGFQLKALNYFVSSCWQLAEFQAAIILLKKLIDTTASDTLLLKKLGETYLEKRFQEENSNHPPRFSLIDKQMATEYLSRITHFDKIRDLAFFLELKGFVLDTLLWGTSDPARMENEPAYQNAEAGSQGQNRTAKQPPVNFDLCRDLLGRLTPATDLLGYAETPRSSITYEDFKERGSSLFQDSGPQHVQEGSEVIICIKLCSSKNQNESSDDQQVAMTQKKFWIILREFLEKYNYSNIWTLSDGAIVLGEDILNAVSFCTDVLNKLNYYNALNEDNTEIHLAMGVHHSTNLQNLNSEQILGDFRTGVRLATASELDLGEKDSAVFGKILHKVDRIFLSSQANRKVNSAERFKVNSLGTFKLKYADGPVNLHEVSWRNPVNELKFGYVNRLGRFELMTEIGGDDLLKVYKAKDSSLQRLVILKVVQSEAFNSLPATSKPKTEFYRIAKTASQFNHPNIAKIYEVDEDRGLTFIAREFIEGTPLTEIFSGKLNIDRFVKVIYRTLKGLQYVHRSGVWHHNLKPNNVLVGVTDETKITDFQIRTALVTANHSSHPDKNFFYAAPEQIHGQPGDGRSDIFAMGLIMYEALAQTHPFVDKGYGSLAEAILKKQPVPPSAIRSDVIPFFDALTLKCLEKDPDQRFQTIEHIVALLKKNFERTLFSNFNFQIAQSRDSA